MYSYAKSDKNNPCSRPKILACLLILGSAMMSGCNSGNSNASIELEDHQEDSPAAPDINYATKIPTLYLAMATEDLNELYSRDPFSNDRLPASYRSSSDEKMTELHSIRYRGNSSRSLPKKSFNIRFNEPQKLLFGSQRMNANSMYTDGSMMREHLAFNMFHHLELTASRTQYVNLNLNGYYEGLYIHIERVDEDLLAAAGLNPDGTLVRDDFRSTQKVSSAFGFALSEIQGTDQLHLVSNSFDSRGDPDWEALTELILWAEDATPGDAFVAEFSERFNRTAYTDWLAVHFLIGDIDSFGDDYWLYLDHHDPEAKWQVIPWDKDLSFGSHYRSGFGVANDFFSYETPIGSGWDNKLVEMYLSSPELRGELVERMAYLMQNVFTQKYFADEIAKTSEYISSSVDINPGVREFIVHPKNHHSNLNFQKYQNEALTDYVKLRYDFLLNWMEPTAGNLYESQIDLTGVPVNKSVNFTDSGGWTIGSMKIISAPTVPGTVKLSVSKDRSIQGIDRVWRIDNTGSDFKAEITLYYRNDINSTQRPDNNWYTDGDVAVGNQWELKFGQKFGNNLVLDTASKVNPYSNRVQSGPVTINYGAGQKYVVAFD